MKTIFISFLLFLSFNVYAQKLIVNYIDFGLGMGKLKFVNSSREGSIWGKTSNTLNGYVGFQICSKKHTNKTHTFQLNYNFYQTTIAGSSEHHNMAFSDIKANVKKHTVHICWYPHFLQFTSNRLELSIGGTFIGRLYYYHSGIFHETIIHSPNSVSRTTINFIGHEQDLLYHQNYNIGLVYQASIKLIEKNKNQLRLNINSGSNLLTEYSFGFGAIRAFRVYAMFTYRSLISK